jgi:hypothetical protein
VPVVLSWRLAVTVAIVVAARVGGLGWVAAVGCGVVVGLVLVVAAGRGSPRAAEPGTDGVVRSRRRPDRRGMDPFTLGEPWRRLVQSGQRAATELHRTVESTPPGPLQHRLSSIADRLDRALDETWAIARRGDEIDDAVRRLDPPRLRSTLDVLRERAAGAPSDELAESIASVEHQLATTERLKQQSARAAARLRLGQTRLDELAVRATEVSIGAGDTDVYEHDVEDLVVELESLRLAIEETNRP